ncbi:MAG: radical SAM protein [Pyrinomonadaceae bacterium]
MKVCLISPPTVIEFDERLVAESEAARLIFEHAPMGILSLAAVLDQQGVETEIIDLNRWYYEYASSGVRRQGVEFCAYAGKQLEGSSADIFGFSTICGSYPLTLRLARNVRATHPQAAIILGGPQASVVDVATLESFPFIDLIVRGEAEETLPRVLDALSHQQTDLEKIAGVTYRKSHAVLRNPNAPVIEDLDSLPMAGFHLYSHIEGCSYAPLEAGRGCPFACSFCSTNDFFRRRFRMKSPHVLVEQMKTIKRRYGINSFDLIHDMFTVDRKRVVSFCEAVEQSGETLYWGCSARTDCIDDELIDLMAANGCMGIFFGVDSGSNRVQALIQKRLNLTDAAARIKHAHRRGIRHTVSMITGFPEETKEDLRDTINFMGEALRHHRAKLQLHLLAPLAETPITTQYQDQLVFDDIFSDMSLQGWDQDPEERAMIIKYPKLFPNFYGIPTRWLDRQYLREVREFMLNSIARVRWFMVLLHRDSGDLLRVFDEWVAWSAQARKVAGVVNTSRRYYSSDDFPRDLARFVASRYLENAQYPHLMKTMVDVEAAQYDFPEKGNAVRATAIVLESLESVPVIAPDARVLIVTADYKRLMRSLKRKERLDSLPIEEVPLGLVKENGKVRVVQLNRTTYQLMQLCNGSRNIKEIARGFSAGKKLGVSPLKASVFGLASLAQQGFIDIRAARN